MNRILATIAVSLAAFLVFDATSGPNQPMSRASGSQVITPPKVTPKTEIPMPPKAVKFASAPPIHSAKGVIASPFKASHIKHPRGLNKTPRYKLASAKKFDKAGIAIPSQVLMLPTQLSMWGNDQFGDCVSACEAARKAAYSVYCGLPETFIPEANVIAWAQKYGYLNGADLTEVMTTMQTHGMTASDGKVYTDGPYASVDYTDENALKAALVLGPVNVGIDANALPSGAGNDQGWYAFGGTPGEFSSEDHCVPIFGFGPTPVLFAALNKAFNVNVTPPANAPANAYLFYTWSTIGVCDHAWIMSTVGETWSQNPTTNGQLPTPIPPTPPTPPNPPTPTTDSVTITITQGGKSTTTVLPLAATIPSGMELAPLGTADKLKAIADILTPAAKPKPPEAKKAASVTFIERDTWQATKAITSDVGFRTWAKAHGIAVYGAWLKDLTKDLANSPTPGLVVSDCDDVTLAIADVSKAGPDDVRVFLERYAK